MDVYKVMQTVTNIPRKDKCAQFTELLNTKLNEFDKNTQDSLMHEIDILVFQTKLAEKQKEPSQHDDHCSQTNLLTNSYTPNSSLQLPNNLNTDQSYNYLNNV